MRIKDNEPQFESICEAKLELVKVLDSQVSWTKHENSPHVEEQIRLRRQAAQDAINFIAHNISEIQE